MEEIRRKNEQIRNIERDVLELKEMFQDLHTLVEQQQENLDVIENNLVSAKDQTANAHESLLKVCATSVLNVLCVFDSN